MIQRKQTIYLFLVALLMVVSGIVSAADADKIHFLLLTVWSAIIAFASFATIFIYNKRRKQMTLCKVGIVALLIWMAGFIYIYYAIQHAALRYPLYAILPVVCIILYGMAYKGIKHDDDLVRSADRIR